MRTMITLAIAALLSATAAHAEVVTKGGASALLKNPAPRTAAPAKAMKCANCKSEFVTVSAPTFKGTAPAVTQVERHACASCGTKWVTTGHGKTKIDVAVHTCDGCAM